MSWPIKFSIYGAGDASSSGAFPSLAPALWRQLHQLQQKLTNEKIAGVAQLDGVSHPTMRWILDPKRRFKTYTLGETNTGDPRGLVDFCSWSFARCPAELDVLVLSGHGLAFQDNRTGSYLGRGAVSHMPMFRTNKKLFGNLSAGFSRAVLVDQDDFVSVPELKGALGQIANLRQDSSIGVVVFDACLMSNVELLYEIHEFADTAVGSVDELSGAGLDLSGAATIATNRLRRGEEMDSEKMAAAFSDSFSPAWTTDSCVAVSLDTKQQQSLLVAFQKFVIALSALDLAERQTNSKIRIALSDGSRRLSRYQSKSLSDIAAFCSAFMSEDFPKKVRNAAKRFLSASESIVLNAKLGSDYERALGISIFSPSSFAEFRKDRLDYSGLSFAKKTGWLKFLEAVYADEIYETV